MSSTLRALAATAVIATAVEARSLDCPPRPSPSVDVVNPFDLVAVDGVLRAGLAIRSREMSEFPLKVCYAYESPAGTVEAPTLRLAPGDLLDLELADRLTYVPQTAPTPTNSAAPHDPCVGGVVAATSTNLVFDGLTIPQVCHQGEATATTIETGDPPFAYRFRIPADNPPGMHLYHPHHAGSAALQVDSGASGVLIVDGMAAIRPEVSGLPERILVLRQQFDEAGTPDSESWISVNFQPVGYRHLPPPVIRMRPRAEEFWRVANATSGTFLALQVADGRGAQRLRLVAIDGIPTKAGRTTETVELPPGGRAEFIVTGPAPGQDAKLVQARLETGPIGTESSAQVLATVLAAPDAAEPLPTPVPSAAQSDRTLSGNRAPATPPSQIQRRLYFAEAANGTNGPTRFFLTAEGHIPTPFDPSAPPEIVTRIGAVEDWIVANHSGQTHAFGVQGMHLLLLAVNGESLPDPEVRDTVAVPAWDGRGSYPFVRLRMDFSNPMTAGAHIAECHVLRHAEGGMMSMVQVDAK